MGLGLAYLYLKRPPSKNGSFIDPIPPHYIVHTHVNTNAFLPKISPVVPLNKVDLPIIMYHYVEYVKDKNDTIRQRLDTNPYTFEEELKAINDNGYTTYFVKEIPEILEGKIKAPAKSVVLTFDDGYEDFYTDAFPLIKKYHVKATIYIIYDFIGRPNFMNAKELKEVADSGLVEVGSHTLDHAYLKKAKLAYATSQIVNSKKDLENLLGLKVETFAYPFGAFDEQAINILKEASYSAAVSEIYGSVQTPDNLYFLSRIRSGFFAGSEANTLKALQTVR